MNRNREWVRWILIGVACVTGGWTPASMFAEETLTLHDAVRQGKVKVEVQSRGGAAGSTVRVDVQKAGAGDLRVEVAPGTVLLNAESSEQNVTVGQLKGEFTEANKYRPGNVMVLVDDQKHSFLLEVYCLDYAKKAPRKGGQLDLAVQDKRVARILNPPADVKPTLGATQIAIWMDRAGITPEQARKRFRGTTTDVDVQVARQLLAHAEKQGEESIPADMPATVRVHVSKLFSTDPVVREQAAELLGRMGAEALPALPYLVENLLDRSTDKSLPANVVRVQVDMAIEAAEQTLARLGLPGLKPLLDAARTQAGAAENVAPTEGVDGASAVIASDAIRSASGTVSEVLVDVWILRLANPRVAVRERAAWLLGTSGNQRAVEPLIRALEDADQQVRTTVANALETLTGQEFGTDVAKWREWSQKR
jgi:hypothetical protein